MISKNEVIISPTLTFYVIENADISDAKFVSSRKRSLRPTSETMIGFSPKQLNNSEIKVSKIKVHQES